MESCSFCSRRKFIGGLVATAGAVSQWRAPMASAQGTLGPDLNSVLPLRLADFPALAQPGGSIMLTCDGGSTVLYIIRGTGEAAFVMDPTCPHAGCRVNRYDVRSAKTLCPCHGSAFALDGSLLNGPARGGLKIYPSQVSNGVLEIELPEFEFGIAEVLPVRTGSGLARLALRFPTRSGAAYRLRRSTSTAGPFQPAAFSLSKDDLQTRIEVPGNGEAMTVYVDATAPRSFFKLELMVSTVG